MFTKLNSLSGSIPLFSPDGHNFDSYKHFDDELKAAQKKLDKIDNDINRQPSFFQRNKNTLLLIGFMALATLLLAVGLFTPYGPQNFTAFDSLASQKGGAIAFENAKLASGFVTAGFALPIVIGAIGCLSLLSSYFSHKSKINEYKQSKNRHQQEIEIIKGDRNNEIQNMVQQTNTIRERNIIKEEFELQQQMRRFDRGGGDIDDYDNEPRDQGGGGGGGGDRAPSPAPAPAPALYRQAFQASGRGGGGRHPPG